MELNIKSTLLGLISGVLFLWLYSEYFSYYVQFIPALNRSGPDFFGVKLEILVYHWLGVGLFILLISYIAMRMLSKLGVNHNWLATFFALPFVFIHLPPFFEPPHLSFFLNSVPDVAFLLLGSYLGGKHGNQKTPL